MRRLLLVAALCWACALALAGAVPVAADVYSPITLLSLRQLQEGEATTLEQADEADQSVISADGQYVAFAGSFGAVRGIWRLDLHTGVVEQVAPGTASLPSISADGRYVSFTTPQALAPEDDHNHAPDVYVRDMEKPCQTSGGSCLPCPDVQNAAEREACPFALVSALNGSGEGATYGYSHVIVGEEALFGSFASPRSAMSETGEYVVFQSEVESNLAGPGTPPDEIFLRNVRTQETRLVSSEYDPSTNTDTGVPVPDVEGVGAAYPVQAFGVAQFGGASISADGSTVAWLGRDVGRQAKLLAGEQTTPSRLKVDEPLWRRVSEAPEAPTRRVTGNSEPENPACVASGESEPSEPPSLLDPCQGPFTFRTPEFSLLNPTGNFVPQLSAHGEKAAFLASAPEVAAGEEFGAAEADDDLYVSQLGAGLNRKQALQRVTEISGTANEGQYAPIVDYTLSPQGDQLAFATQRTQFSLASLSDVSPVAAQIGVKELFDVDLGNDTLTRVTHGYGGEAVPSEQEGESERPGEVPPAQDGASSPSFSEDGNTLVFSSSADNLVYGDGNDASDVFAVTRETPRLVTPVQSVSSAPPPPPLSPSWQLFASAVSKDDGQVVLDVEVPGAGELSASVSGAVPVTVSARRAVRGKRGKGRAAKTLTAVMTRTLATARRTIPSQTSGLEQLTLTLPPAYARLAQRAGGLYTTVTLRFSTPGRPVLTASLGVTFKRTLPALVGHSSGRRRTHAKKRGRR